jgi:hypothetical protein
MNSELLIGIYEQAIDFILLANLVERENLHCLESYTLHVAARVCLLQYAQQQVFLLC